MFELLQTIALLCQVSAYDNVRNIKWEQKQCQVKYLDCTMSKFGNSASKNDVAGYLAICMKED